jgi:hypothetical protein
LCKNHKAHHAHLRRISPFAGQKTPACRRHGAFAPCCSCTGPLETIENSMKSLSLLISVFLTFQGLTQIDTTVYQVNAKWNSSRLVKGNIRTIEWHSESLNELRKISIYEPFNFHKDSIYDIVLTTDNQCSSLASLLENDMILNKIEPLIIVGVHNRESQPIDTIFNGHEIDFRMKEMLGDIWMSKKLST